MTALLTETQRENQDTRLIPLSALQHYAFCPRQCALIHNEQAWAENYLTAQGKALHERVDSDEPETRKGVRFERTVHVSVEKPGISGILDLVEADTKTGRLKPVEYKRGKPKPDPGDEIQLCAQGLCLEEMTGQTVSEGALWYMQTRHRVPVVFSDGLRAQTLATIAAVCKLLNSGQTPPPDYGKRC
ncbi:CRISPR-associated protein Cas4, partial [Neisseria gonorrhoeae]